MENKFAVKEILEFENREKNNKHSTFRIFPTLTNLMHAQSSSTKVGISTENIIENVKPVLPIEKYIIWRSFFSTFSILWTTKILKPASIEKYFLQLSSTIERFLIEDFFEAIEHAGKEKYEFEWQNDDN